MTFQDRIERLKKALEENEKERQSKADPGSAESFRDWGDRGRHQPWNDWRNFDQFRDWEIMGH